MQHQLAAEEMPRGGGEVEELDSDDISDEEEEEAGTDKARSERKERITSGKLSEREQELVHVMMSEMNETKNLVAWITQEKRGHVQGRILALTDFRVITLKKGKMTRKGHSTLYVSKSLHLFDLLGMRSDVPTKVTLVFKTMELEIDSALAPDIVHTLRTSLHRISPASKFDRVEENCTVAPAGQKPFSAELVSTGDLFVGMYQAWCNYHGGTIRLSVCKYLQSLFPIAPDSQASVNILACFQEEMQGCAVPLNATDLIALGAALQDSQVFRSVVAQRLPWAGPIGAAALLGSVITPSCSLSLTTLCLRQVSYSLPFPIPCTPSLPFPIPCTPSLPFPIPCTPSLPFPIPYIHSPRRSPISTHSLTILTPLYPPLYPSTILTHYTRSPYVLFARWV
jgi:hypothetical protein